MGVPPPEEEMLMATVCPSGAPDVVPEMVTEESSAALRRPSPPSLMATEMVGLMALTVTAFPVRSSMLTEESAPGTQSSAAAML